MQTCHMTSLHCETSFVPYKLVFSCPNESNIDQKKDQSADKHRKKKISATQASLCPSSNCTGDPEDCRLEPLMEQGVENSLRCDACQGGSAVRWCWNECPVDVNHECCYNPGCYRKMKAECWWRDYMTGAFRPKVVSSFLLDQFSLTFIGLPCPKLSIR